VFAQHLVAFALTELDTLAQLISHAARFNLEQPAVKTVQQKDNGILVASPDGRYACDRGSRLKSSKPPHAETLPASGEASFFNSSFEVRLTTRSAGFPTTSDQRWPLIHNVVRQRVA
jgi:hypothetical protein